MTASPSDLDKLINDFATALEQPESAAEPEAAEVSMRERFFELLVLALANLYGKTPVATTLFDRAMLRSVTVGMDDNEAGKLTLRTEDWMRLEGLVRGQEGTKNYSLSRMSMAVLSTITQAGTFGEVLEKIQAIYVGDSVPPALRRLTRLLGAYFVTRLGRS